MENILELKTINDLNKYAFYIPSYQRGYRWTKKEVEDLLNDINDFKPRQIGDSDNKTWYCLQPIVIKQKEKDNEFEVIDGQQRLTTIFLILHYLNQDFVVDKRDKLFELDYQTRTGTKKFWQQLDENTGNDENIDFYYIKEAYKKICQWFSGRENFDKNDFRSKFNFHSKVIWYQSIEDNPIAIFTRINIGKIPLTNAELIKALFLNSSNFEKNNPEKLKLKQLEIANEWDQIEYTLQNDRFWYFISGNKNIINRIEFIFNLMNEEEDSNDTYSTFRYFSNKFQNRNQNDIEKNWQEIKIYFQRFSEWFDERDLYHKIGYLVCIDAKTIKDLYRESNSLKKTEFRIYLDNSIKESLKNIDINELQYGDKNVKKVLLLYNILTMLNSPKDNSYFPFELFKNEKWDIEHITSVKDGIPDSKTREAWLKEATVFIDDTTKNGKELKKRAEACDINDEELFKKIFEDIVSHFNSDINDEDINDISNLTILDSETNRGYKNAVFPLKRKTIIERDKVGIFIPICTKNVFLKYFSEYPPKISFWTQDDRENYDKDLRKVLNNYIGVQ